MVAAREYIFARGHYAPITLGTDAALAVVPTVNDGASPFVVHLAGGTGYYLSAVLDVLPGAVGLDVELSP